LRIGGEVRGPEQRLGELHAITGDVVLILARDHGAGNEIGVVPSMVFLL